jgi:hypothetical protein
MLVGMSARVSLFFAVLVGISCARSDTDTRTRAPADGRGPDRVETVEQGPPALLAAESQPTGIEPLSRAELAKLEVECGRITARVQAPAMKMEIGPDAMLAMLDVVAQLRGNESRTDCLELAERDVKTQLAGMLDREALRTVQWLTGKLHQRLKRGDDLCPSAAPVPASLDALRAGPPSIDPAEWERAGWEKDGEACLDVDWRDLAKRLQVELQTDFDRRTAKIIARGFPVVGGELSEVFVVVRVEGDDVEISDVMRVGGVALDDDE